MWLQSRRGCRAPSSFFPPVCQLCRPWCCLHQADSLLKMTEIAAGQISGMRTSLPRFRKIKWLKPCLHSRKLGICETGYTHRHTCPNSWIELGKGPQIYSGSFTQRRDAGQVKNTHPLSTSMFCRLLMYFLTLYL